MITEISGYPYSELAFNKVEERRKERELTTDSDDLSTADSSEKIRTPFERLSERIKKTDLSYQQKKIKLHYVKNALTQMDEDQAREFEKNMNVLLNFSKPVTLSFIQNIESKDNSFKTLQEIEDYLEKENQKLKGYLNNSDESNVDVFDSLADKVNDIINDNSAEFNKNTGTINIQTYEENLLDDYIQKLNNDFAILFADKGETESPVDLYV